MVAWILILILILLVIFGVVAIVVAKKGKKRPTDYYALFLMGAVWLPFGIIMSITDSDSSVGSIFFILGLVYFLVGLSHRKEWKKNHTPFNKLSKRRQRFKIAIFIILGILLLVGLVVFYVMGLGVFS